ncbi:N-acetyltransferase family protein [Clostridium paraputrificum]|uniref:GNAT family N-acetyltransferase n=1 Tax=Clostridium TaxID=1485 RepID=UPI003D326BAF
MIRKVVIEDAKAIVDIYNYYILNTNITFEEEKLNQEDMEERIKEKIKDHPWIVYEEEGQVIGYGYLGEWRSRSAYRFSKESSIYIDVNARGKGVGIKLYSELIKLAVDYGYHAIVAGITIPNDASVGLHEKLGFEKIAEFKEIGFKNNEWLNVAYWQMILDDNNK